jgi:hypothetical protein
MLTNAEFNQLLAVVGEPVTFHQVKAPQAVVAGRAIIQSNSKAADAIISSFGVTGQSIQMPVSMFAVPPEKFDYVVRANGERLVFEMVDARVERGSGMASYYVGYSKGK